MTKKASESVLSGDNLPFIEDLYRQYLQDPDSVDSSWIPWFEEHFGDEAHEGNGRAEPSFSKRSIFSPRTNGAARIDFSEAEYSLEPSGQPLKAPGKSTKFAARVQGLIQAYRLHGHLVADIDPLGRPRRDGPPELEIEHYGFDETDLEATVKCPEIFGDREVTLRKVVDRLRALYCGSIGVEYTNIPDPEKRDWLREQIEGNNYAAIDNSEERKNIYEDLVRADAFESFLHTKYVGAKRFSLSGGDSLIPLMVTMLDEAGALGVHNSILGMAHRGRLNVLHNIMGKPAHAMLSEFEKAPNPEDYLGSSDVKYHMGYSSDFETRTGGEVHLSLTFNPSHLEFVNPVVLGRARAKQDRNGPDRSSVLPLLLHGDAAFIGQGIVAESLNLAGVEGFDVAGCVHIVINNQIGFTAMPEETRSTIYSTDIAKILEVPIFHVNADDPEAVVRVAKLATRWRQKFKQDAVIDLVCYRRYGHNEGDEPRFTQPKMYARVDDTRPVREKYAETLIESGVMTKDEIQAIWDERWSEYQSAYEEIHESPQRADVSSLSGVWTRYEGGPYEPNQATDTGIPIEKLKELGKVLTDYPDDFNIHRTIKRLFSQRREMIEGERPINWAMAEALAMASILDDGARIRFSGQDSVRATFSQRHAAITDTETGERFWPARHIREGQGTFEVYNSILSEAAVLGYEYGYSLDYPDGLVMWEAQFGDFANGAQVIIDQFISSGEDKWKRLSGLVMLLPHGYEGQGPEHSSARLERFLQLCAEDNMFVGNFTTPAQYFHALRRQLTQHLRKPLVIMTPKSLLRHKLAVSSLEDLAEGQFRYVLPESREHIEPDKVKRVVMCSGKVYYDMIQYAEEKNYDETAIVRIEQLFPLNVAELQESLEPFKNAEQIKWVQEEPKNMGAWTYLLPQFIEIFGAENLPTYVGRVASASPATGSHESHELEERRLLARAFDESE